MLESHDYVQLPGTNLVLLKGFLGIFLILIFLAAVTKSTINVAYIGEFKNLKGFDSL